MGDNTFVVTVSDAATKSPVANANITATPNMIAPRLPGPQTSGRAQGGGVYHVPVMLGVATRYQLQLKIERPGKPDTELEFPVEASQ